MFKARNMRVLLVVSALFLLFSSVNMVPARSFFGDIVKKESEKYECLILFFNCVTDEDCRSYTDYNCNSKLKGVFIFISNLQLLLVI